MNTKIHPLLTRDNQRQLTELLRDSRSTIGREVLGQLLPPPLKLYVDAHDTGCQPRIELTAEGRERITVWAGSVWYSSSYAFNDDRMPFLGLNPECLFLEATLVQFFKTVESLHSEILADRAMGRATAQAEATEKRQEDLDFYQSLFQKGQE